MSQKYKYKCKVTADVWSDAMNCAPSKRGIKTSKEPLEIELGEKASCSSVNFSPFALRPFSSANRSRNCGGSGASWMRAAARGRQVSRGSGSSWRKRARAAAKTMGQAQSWHLKEVQSFFARLHVHRAAATVADSPTWRRAFDTTRPASKSVAWAIDWSPGNTTWSRLRTRSAFSDG
eukprot:2904943-Prymnesium_polylepis.2